MVTWGKGIFDIGNVSTPVSIGYFDQDTKELLIKILETMNADNTIAIHKPFDKYDLAVAMWVRPWIVEVSKNSLTPSMTN